MLTNIEIFLHSARSGDKINPNIVNVVWNEIQNDKAARGLFKSFGVETELELEDFFNDDTHIISVGVLNNRLAAMVWLDCIADKTARIHFVSFAWSYRNGNLEVCQKAVKTLFGTNMFDCFLGFTPTYNKLALSFIKKVGFVDVGVVPLGQFDKKSNKSIDVLCTYCTREMI